MKPVRILLLVALTLELAAPAWAQQTISGAIIRNGTAPLSALAQSGATTNQVPQWSGTAWVAASLTGLGNPTDVATFGSGSAYSLTQGYANTGIAPITLSSGNMYRLTGNVDFSESTSAGDDLRAYLYDSTAGYMIPWSERRISSNALSTASPAPVPHTELPLDVIYTAPGNDTIQLWACDASAARGTITPYLTRLTAEQVNGSSSQTQQSLPSLPTTGLVSHYDASTSAHLTLSGSSVTAWADQGSANLTLSPSTADPTYLTNVWNGLGMVQTTASTGGMVTSSVPTTNLTFDMFCVCGTTSSTNIPICENGRSSTGYQFYAGTSANNYEGGLNASAFANTAVTPTNGFFLLELQRSGTTTTFYIDGVSEGTSSTTPNTPITGMVVGTSATIDIGEVLLYNAPLSAGNQTTVTNYLTTKWGL